MSDYRPRPPKPPSREILERNEFEGTIGTVTYQSDDGTFKIVSFQPESGCNFKAKGNLYGADSGLPARIKGQWKEEPKWGWTFVIESYMPIEPTTEEAILAYLGSGLIKGLGKSKAKKIVDHFGEKTIEILDSVPELLSEISGFGNKTARKVSEQWEAHRASREVMMFLKKFGLSNAIAIKLIRHYGEQAAAIMRTNPYRAGLDVRGIGFVKADEIAGKMGIAKDSPERIQAAFVHLLDKASSEGHTFLPREMLLERADEMLGIDHEKIQNTLDEAVKLKYIHQEPVGDFAECYFIPSLYACESGIAKRLLSDRYAPKPIVSGNIDDKIREFEKKYHFDLAPQQQEAIRSALSGGICVITGGPGTGKTTLVRALLHIAKGPSVRFALCSPTGRAAQRLAETTREDASTVHRLLKWNAQTGKFIHNHENLLPLDLLIVDEASMLDIPLAYSLLRAVPERATVVFVGDVDQLPSVGPGTFLRDLIRSGRAKTTRLNVIFRQAQQSLIITNSHRINEGHSLKLPKAGDEKADFFFVDRDNHEKLREAMITMATDRIPKKLNCDPVDGVQILSPMRVGPLGTAEMNRLLQQRLNPDGEQIAGSPFRRGDKVIQTSNNYDLDVYNGDVGRILGLNRETRQVMIAFGKRVVYYPFENVDELELAYAITIHKSQGSEYPAVVVLMHTSHYIMLKRNLIYTAVTRGKKLVVIIGNKRALYKAIKTSPEEERITALEYWLTRPPENEDLFE